ncbi:MAG: AAA family ATPase, partial [Okeania sp. SIO3H1]|nr:AAA family ATPase [Okeania sp. SIO3H1]
NLPGVVKSLSLENYGNGYALVMEDNGAISLDKYESLDLETCLKIAIQLADILHKLYQNRVIHKDIKPANIVIHPQTQQVKLIDFSIASVLPFETTEIQNPKVLEGTLAYISPEQTGRMNRGIDYRSDFYSLGVSLYQLLTGELPFTSDDAMELVHCHMAKMPPTPDLRFPTPFVNIVMKLMAKNAEDRYQSALGLRFDLEKCLSQWEEVGKIEAFELGERDISARFLIPEKLYGREKEVQTLLDAFGRVTQGQSEIFMVAGYSGVGKTAVVNEVHKPIVRQRGFFIKGKFDQFQRNIPFSAFVQAFRDLMGQLLSESDEGVEGWKNKILNALGENAQVMIEVIPELEAIIGKQPAVADLSGSAAQNRFNLLFGKFIRVFTTPEHPLVIFIDDLQWADFASLKLMQLLMSDSESGSLLLLGAYRDNEVFLAHPLMLSLDEIEKSGVTLNTITLELLSPTELNRLVADTLCCEFKLGLPLTELVYGKSKGNPFFATQFLKGLHEDGWISFNFDVGYWQCDLTRVRELALSDDVVEFMATRLQKLPEKTQEVLKLAACISNQFELATLAVVSEQSQVEVASCLWGALQEGLVLPLSETYKFFQGAKQSEKTSVEGICVRYKFLHDRVQQAAYSLIPPDQKQAVHLKVGQLLWQETPQEQFEDKLFDIVNQLNIGSVLMEEVSEREELAKLNLRAGQKAKISTAYEGAIGYLNNGLALLPADSWQTHYALTRDLSIAVAEAEYLNVNLDRAEELITLVLPQTKTLLEQIPIYKLQIGLELARYRLVQGLEKGLQVLKLLGFPLEEASEEVPQLPDLASIESLPIAEDPRYLAAMEIATHIYAAAVVSNPKIYEILVKMTVALTREFGQSPTSAYAYASYGMLQSGAGNLELGYQAGLLAVGILDRFADKIFKCKVYAVFNAFIRIWNEPLGMTLDPLREAIQSGLETGDYEYAGYCMVHHIENLLWMGTPFYLLWERFEQYIELARRIENPYALLILRAWQQMVLNLSGQADNPYCLVGEHYNEITEIEKGKAQGIEMILFQLYVNKIVVLYLFGDYAKAVVYGESAMTYQHSAYVKLYESAFVFYYALALLANCRQMETEQQDYLDRVAEQQKRLQLWACRFPTSFQDKCDLVAAEKARVEGNYLQAIDLYDQAIVGARKTKFVHNEALANELAAKFYLDWGKENIARTYMQEAYYCYSRWGAKAKVDDLTTRYPSLLTSILERPKLGWIPGASIATMTKGTISTTTGAKGEILDLATLMKASRTLSEEISLEGAIANLMQVAMENAGAETVVLMLFQQEVLMLTAIVTAKGTSPVEPIPAETSNAVPRSIINRVKRSRETLVLENATQETTYAGDAYIQKYQPQSILCLPLINRGQFIGILYLENNQLPGAFTSHRVEVLNLLSSQAAISLENARLYEESQNYAQQLEKTQLQLVKNEKMASIGELTAGVAHEINNPVGFISGNLTFTSDYTQDLIELLQLYQAELPEPSEIILQKIEDTELDYLIEDLPQSIDSMKRSIERIAQISRSMSTFSRSDTVFKVLFNIHEGINSTLLILKHRLKANVKRPEIEVVKNYGDLPEIKCYPGQLNQVFMNLIANAIDALEESNIDQTFEEIQATPNQIIITTEIDSKNQQIIIRIRDNGMGMSESVKAQIFEHLFTTKAVGKGTGLGLSISRQIVEEKHGGKLTCISSLGAGTEFTIALPNN